MNWHKCGLAAAATLLITSYAAQGQAVQPGNASIGNAAPGVLRLNVVLEGGSVEGLQKDEVKLLDNGRPVDIRSLQPRNIAAEPTHVILVIDDVNARLTTVAYERSELKKYFLKNEGRLSVPFTIAVMTDTKTEIQQGSSQNGNAENDALQKYEIGLHQITRDAQYGALDRTNIGIKALMQLVQYASSIPGHKLILFVSPGWPLLSGPRIDLSAKEAEGIYATVARLQDAMLQADVTLHMVNPFGPTESLLRSDYYQAFLKGVKRPGDAEISDLSLQVLATHNGGVVYQGSSDIAGMVEQSVSHLDHSYSLAFTPAPGEAPNGYHELKTVVSRPGVTVRAPDEYYAPLPSPPER